MAKRSRQTIDVAWLKERLQYALDHTDHLDGPLSYTPNRDGSPPTPAQAARMTVAGILSDILMETGNYHGFTYQYWQQYGWDEWVAAGRPESTAKFLDDHTKVTYY